MNDLSVAGSVSLMPAAVSPYCMAFIMPGPEAEIVPSSRKEYIYKSCDTPSDQLNSVYQKEGKAARVRKKEEPYVYCGLMIFLIFLRQRKVMYYAGGNYVYRWKSLDRE